MSKFNWQLSTIDELAQHIYNSPPNSIKQQVNYYKCTNNNIMLGRVAAAKKLVKLWKLEEEVSKLKVELYGTN